jgi:UDP-N-acetylmuramate dehydrogenase
MAAQIRDYGDLLNLLTQQQVPFELAAPLVKYTSFRIGGAADVLVFPRSAEELALIQSWANERPVRTFLLGGGSNILISDSGFPGIVVHPAFSEDLRIDHQTADHISVFVAASAKAPLSGKKLSAMGFAGLEFLTTIPGQFGGSIIQNAGCYGHELKDVITSVEIVAAGKVQKIAAGACAFEYRTSLFKNEPNMWVTGAQLDLGAGSQPEINARIEDYKQRRINSQPRNRRSAGSIFKNPVPSVSEKKSWQLIDEAGLRGHTCGGAEISAEHCNFIVNNGEATAAEVYTLIRLAESRVWENSGIKLEREVVLVGDFGQ